MNFIIVIFDIIQGIISPILWFVLGIIFCIKRIDTKKSLVLMLSALRIFAVNFFPIFFASLVSLGAVSGIFLYIGLFINTAFFIAMCAIVLSYHGNLTVRMVSAGLFFCGCLLYWGLLNVMLPEYLSVISPILGALFYMAGALVFIFGTREICQHPHLSK